MVLGSHNSWSFLKAKKWWVKPFAFMAKCQSVPIATQYYFYDVRCFDLRLNFDKKGNLFISHGGVRYDYTLEDLMNDLSFLNNRTDKCYLRLLYDVRTKKGYTDVGRQKFVEYCKMFEEKFPNLLFWCGRCVYNWNVEYKFKNTPSCEEKYSSVCPPYKIDDWFPYIYAKLKNKRIKKKGTKYEILLIDFVNIG